MIESSHEYTSEKLDCKYIVPVAAGYDAFRHCFQQCIFIAGNRACFRNAECNCQASIEGYIIAGDCFDTWSFFLDYKCFGAGACL